MKISIRPWIDIEIDDKHPDRCGDDCPFASGKACHLVSGAACWLASAYAK